MKALFLLAFLLVWLLACGTKGIKPPQNTTEVSGIRIDTLPADSIHPMMGKFGCVPRYHFNLGPDNKFQKVNIPNQPDRIGIKVDTITMHVTHHIITKYWPGLINLDQTEAAIWDVLVSNNLCQPTSDFGIGICDNRLVQTTIDNITYFSCKQAALMCGKVQYSPDTTVIDCRLN
jgi:hypothetical protein